MCTSSAINSITHDPAQELNSALADMLTRYGYTTVVDIASDRDNTLALRARIDKGEVRGPRILTAGLPIFPHEGLPIYISHLPKSLLDKLPQPATVDKTIKALRENFAAGADVTKLFIATPQGNGAVKRIPPEIAQAAVNGNPSAMASWFSLIQQTSPVSRPPSTRMWTSSLIRRSVRRHRGPNKC